MASLRLPWGIVEIPKLNLIVPKSQGLLPQLKSHMLSPAQRINRQILETMAGINPAHLQQLRHASFAGDPSKANPHGNAESVALRDLKSGLAFDTSTGHIASAEHDLRPDPFQRRVEGITRPAILLESPAPADIAKLLSGCHLSHALGADISLDPLITSSKRRKDLAGLLRMLDGTEIAMSSPKFPISIEHNRVAGLRAIFAANPDQLRKLLPDILPLLERSVLLANTIPQFHAHEGANYFADLFARVTSRVAIQRRNGIPLVAEFTAPESAFRFQEQNIRFIATCDAEPNHVGSSIRGLPLSLAWAFLTLRDHMHCGAVMDDEQIISTVFDAAHNLLRRHGDQMHELLEAARCEEIRNRMRAIVRKVEEKRLVSFSHLVRSFDLQKTSLYRPLVDVLVEAEVINRQSDGRLAMGTRRFEEMAPTLPMKCFEH
ncbi:hypothetical protein JIN84_21540 [Luteolibacter yonseiensis]|uniref:Uncharacterized protein n=1 Tax=Luteolibacter yonseiensis TaxID=1144680 RepID=A0A934R8F2_9BACT|nr:hypothetical protein [Luteolibacter yonseiensis]MBK1818222.1 hypothetical protein [Luteolibacter yonseiensis]